MAIGREAGQTDQSGNSIAIGYVAGETRQNQCAIAIGFRAGRYDQSNNAIAIGEDAGIGTIGQGQGLEQLLLDIKQGQKIKHPVP